MAGKRGRPAKNKNHEVPPTQIPRKRGRPAKNKNHEASPTRVSKKAKRKHKRAMQVLDSPSPESLADENDETDNSPIVHAPDVETDNSPVVHAPDDETVNSPVVHAPDVETVNSPIVHAPDVEPINLPLVHAPDDETVNALVVYAPDVELVDALLVYAPNNETVDPRLICAPDAETVDALLVHAPDVETVNSTKDMDQTPPVLPEDAEIEEPSDTINVGPLPAVPEAPGKVLSEEEEFGMLVAGLDSEVFEGSANISPIHPAFNTKTDEAVAHVIPTGSKTERLRGADGGSSVSAADGE